MRSASSTRAWCAGRGAASRTPTIGMTASVRASAGRDAPTSGATIPICARWATCRRSTIPTSSARTSSCGSAVWSRLSPISPSISARSPRARSTSGWSTAMRRREAPRSPSNGRRAASASRSGCAIGASATSPGGAAATSRRRNTPPSTVASPPGPCRRTAWSSPSSAPARTAGISTGRGGSSGRWPSGAASTGCGAGRSITTAARRTARPWRSTTLPGTTCWGAPTGWNRLSRRIGR